MKFTSHFSQRCLAPGKRSHSDVGMARAGVRYGVVARPLLGMRLFACTAF